MLPRPLAFYGVIVCGYAPGGNMFVDQDAESRATLEEERLSPLFRALTAFCRGGGEYAWHTPGHAGGKAFLQSPIGRAYHEFFGEALLRSDCSVSVGKLGSLLDHSGPMGESERYLAEVFGAHRSYHVTSGSSESNRVILTASLTRGSIALVDRSCHKSVKHGIIMTGAIPIYLQPSRNRYGMIGPINPRRLAPEAIEGNIEQSGLAAWAFDSRPVHAVITNPTYDGLIYNVAMVEDLLGRSVDRLHFDEAWFGYARFHPLYAGRFSMRGDPADYAPTRPTIFTVHSTHKLLTALSQASMIHVRYGRSAVPHERFNESFLMHATTSPFYPIIVSNEVSAAIMHGPDGRELLSAAILEAVAFRQTLAEIHDDFAARGDWFFRCWQPDMVDLDARLTPFKRVPADVLLERSALWTLEPGAAWHGFADFPSGCVMLDPIKVTITTPGVGLGGRPEKRGIPARLVSAYLQARGIIPEKTGDFTLLFLFSMGMSKREWQPVADALLAFKRDYDANAALDALMPGLVAANPGYTGLGLRDFADAMFKAIVDLELVELQANSFFRPPRPFMTPATAYEKLVNNEVESLTLDRIDSTELVAATGLAPYPPGIPLLMPGESFSAAAAPGGPLSIVNYLKALEAFDSRFPSFGHEVHGVTVENGRYKVLGLK